MKFGICNETFGDWSWERICRFVAETGYDGIEIAPFTLAADVRTISHSQRREIRQVATDAGLEIIALHWLLVSPEGLHIHTTDTARRLETTDYLKALIDLAGDLEAPVMVLGSPRARTLEDGDLAGAWTRTIQTLTELTPSLTARGVTLCPEALPAPEADFLQTQAEIARLVDAINHPNIQMMLDVKSMCSEPESPATLIRKYASRARHIHVNDANRRGPGFGDTDFSEIAAALKATDYNGYLSVEVFDYSPSPEFVAIESLRHLREIFERASV